MLIGFVEDSDEKGSASDEHGNVVFNNDFICEAKTDAWQWQMDNVDKGAIKPFGRVKMVRK